MSSRVENTAILNIRTSFVWTHSCFSFLTDSRAERKKYYKHGRKAKAQPDKCLLLTADGVDQGKHNLPHSTTTMKVNKISKSTFQNVDEQLQERFEI